MVGTVGLLCEGSSLSAFSPVTGRCLQPVHCLVFQFRQIFLCSCFPASKFLPSSCLAHVQARMTHCAASATRPVLHKHPPKFEVPVCSSWLMATVTGRLQLCSLLSTDGTVVTWSLTITLRSRSFGSAVLVACNTLLPCLLTRGLSVICSRWILNCFMTIIYCHRTILSDGLPVISESFKCRFIIIIIRSITIEKKTKKNNSWYGVTSQLVISVVEGMTSPSL